MAETFANYYQSIYTPLEDVQFDPDFKSQIDLEMKHITATCESDIHDFPGGCITTKELNAIISCLKLRKAPGNDSITNEHIVHGGNHLFDASLIYITPSCLWGKYLFSGNKGLLCLCTREDRSPKICATVTDL